MVGFIETDHEEEIESERSFLLECRNVVWKRQSVSGHLEF